jgi:hypothetical protein
MTSTFVKTVRNFITAGILVTSVSVPVFGQEIQVRPKTIHSDQFSRGWDVIVYPETNLYKCLDGKPVESWKDCHQFISEYLEAHPEKVNLQDQIAPSVQNFSSKVELESWVANIFVNNPEIKSFYFFTGKKTIGLSMTKIKGACKFSPKSMACLVVQKLPELRPQIVLENGTPKKKIIS